MKFILFWAMMAGLLFAGTVSAENNKTLQQLKKDTVIISAEIAQLEAQLFYPKNQQLALHFAVNTGHSFRISELKVLLDNNELINKQYTARQTAALERGGVDKFYVGVLPAGEHKLVAFITGTDNFGLPVKRALTHKFTKDNQAYSVLLSAEQPKNLSYAVLDLVKL
ncbi:hypothetical protein [Psychromonas sp.]|uniref:hypothetical protein n=1 Tax=Psychromonas sp. TaxID=1884585 RepID=UPI00356891C7